ncbi:MAG: hypothetical protein CSYNP_02466 [Syntrophus sp. SKADARSKE-3]|nr:hypothetical protein [Syntrophus sp. SKADARSKE-3]
MSDLIKTNQELNAEISALKQRIQELEISEVERKRTEDALRDSELRYQTIFETTGTTMLIVEEDMTIILANHGFESLTGYTREEVEGKRKWTEFVEKSDLEKMITQHQLRRADPACATKSYEFRLVHRDGYKKNIILTVDLIPGTKKSVASLMDITDRKQAEEALGESRRKLEEIIDFLPDATFVIDKEGKIIAWNKAIEDMTGYRAQEMLGKNDHEYAIPFYGERRLILIDLVNVPDEVFEKQYLSIHRETNILIGEGDCPMVRRERRFLSGWATSIANVQGEIVGAIESIRDITDQIRAEKALRESEARFRDLAELHPAVIFETDQNFRLTFTNRKAPGLFGYSQEDLAAGLDAFSMIVPEDRSRMMENFIRRVQGEELGAIEYTGLKKDGSTFPLLLQAIPVMREDKLVGGRGIVIDITERKKAEEERHYYEKFHGVLEMAGAICHELNQPMQIISGYSEMILKNSTEDDPIHIKLNKINHQIQRMGTITKKLMSIENYETEDYAGLSHIININKSSAKEIE